MIKERDLTYSLQLLSFSPQNCRCMEMSVFYLKPKNPSVEILLLIAVLFKSLGTNAAFNAVNLLST